MDNTPDWMIYVLSAGLAAGSLWAWSKGSVNAKICKGIVMLSMLPLLFQGRHMMDSAILPILRSSYIVLMYAVIIVAFTLLFWGIFETGRRHKAKFM